MTDPNAARTASPLADRVYGAVALILLALAAFYAFRGGPRDTTPAPAPALTLLEPAAGALATQPLTLTFDAGAALRPEAAGWAVERRHVHVRVDATELMPGTTDLVPLGGTRYRWVLPRLPAGEHTVQLFWSDEAHRPLRSGASPPVRIRLP